MTDHLSEQFHHAGLSRGILLNALSRVGGLLGTLWLPLATLLFGLEAMGGYFVLVSLLEISTALLSAGACDAIVIYGSQALDKPADSTHRTEDGLPKVAFLTCLLSTIIVTLVLQLSADALGQAVGLPNSSHLIALLSWGLLPACLSGLVLSVSKTDLRMEESALLNGVVRPLLLPACTLCIFPFWKGTEALVLGFVCFQWLFFACCLFVVGRQIHLGLFFSGSARGRLRQFANFAFPQTLNLTLNRYNSRLDLLMLGHFGADKALIALYGTVLWLTSELRTIRMSVSAAITPIGARLHGRGEKTALAELFNEASRWTTTMVGAALIVVAILLPEMLELLAGKNSNVAEVMDLRFAWVLLLAPFVNCAWGLAGNLMVIAQRQNWTLMNSALTAVMNTLLNLALIPHLGLLGAAIATVFANVSTSSLQLYELSRLEGIRFRWSQIRVPYVALFVVFAASFGLYVLAPPTTWTARLATTIGALSLYLGVLHALGLPEMLRFRALLKLNRSGAGSEEALGSLKP